MAITDSNKLAVGSPALSSTSNAANTGSANVGALTASSSYTSSPLVSAIGLTYNTGVPGVLTMAPASQPVTVTTGGVSTTFPAGTPVTYASGATITIGGFSFAITGTPANGDQFTISPNASNKSGDNRNGLLLAGLQNQGTLNNSKTNYSDAYGQLINTVGNKARELKVTGASEAAVLEQATAAVQSESGVNLDEEAANLLRYQQAYQAAGKMMQIASQLFDVLLKLGQ